MTSPDGITWTAQTAAAGTGDSASPTATACSLWCRTASAHQVRPRLMASHGRGGRAAEANSWNIRHLRQRPVRCGGGQWHARVMTSPDGVTWTAQTAAEANSWNGVTYGNGQFVAVTDRHASGDDLAHMPLKQGRKPPKVIMRIPAIS